MADNKAFKVDWLQINESSSDYYPIEITRPMALALISQLQYLRWRTRWQNAPSNFDAVLSFVDEIEYRLLTVIENAMSCDDVSNCVEQNAGNIFTSNNVYNSVVEQITQQNTNIFNQVFTPPQDDDVPCEDRVFGAIQNVIRMLDRDSRQFFTQTKAVLGLTEFVDDLLSVIAPRSGPLASSLAAAISLVIEVVELLETYYAATASDDYLEQIMCEVFCRLQNRCTISLLDVYDAIDAELPSSIFPPLFSASFEAWVQWLFFDLDKNVIMDAAPLLFWLFLMQAAKGANWVLSTRPVLNLVTRPITERYARAVQVGFEDGDSGHKGLCECREEFAGVILNMFTTASSVASPLDDGYEQHLYSRLWTSPTWQESIGQTVWKMRFDNVRPTQMGCFIYGTNSITNAASRAPIFLRVFLFTHENASGVLNNVALRVAFKRTANSPIEYKTGIGSVALPRGEYWSIYCTREPFNATENNNTYMRIGIRAGVNLVPQGVRYINTGSAVLQNWIRNFS